MKKFIAMFVVIASVAFTINTFADGTKAVSPKITSTNAVSHLPVNYVTTTVNPLVDAANNGTPGGFTLIKVTRKQWKTLRAAGIRLQIFGNVMDTEWPDDMGPILMDKGYGKEVFHVHYSDGKTNHVIGVDQAYPEVFWAAIATWERTQASKQ